MQQNTAVSVIQFMLIKCCSWASYCIS